MSSSSVSSYRTGNGAVILPTDSTRRRLSFDDSNNDEKVPWVAPRIHPTFNSRNLRNINRILRERRESKSKKPVLKSKPLPTIKKLPSVRVTDRFNKTIYTIRNDVYKPARPIPDPSREYLNDEERENRRQAKQKARSQERKKSKFIDDSAVESDGEGGDVPSVHSSPDRSQELKFVNCDLCGLEVSSDKQLEKHRGNKKCRKLRSQGKPTPKCHTCSKIFVSVHDLRRHKVAKNH